jgi:hypothetical protein
MEWNACKMVSLWPPEDFVAGMLQQMLSPNLRFQQLVKQREGEVRITKF